MKIVVLCTKYSMSSESPYLTDELALELVRQGHDVTVLLADWADEHKGKPVAAVIGNGPQVYISRPVVIPWLPLTLQRMAKWLLSSLKMARQARRLMLKQQPDMVVGFSPLVAMYLPVWMLTTQAVGLRFLVQWDFFPDAQVQIGALHGRIKFHLLRAFESYLMRRFDVIGCMSPKNIEYLLQHCDITPRAKVVHLPLWTSCPPFEQQPKEQTRERYGIPINTRVFVFGGQLIKGRGIEDIIAASRKLRNENIRFLFIGDGPLGAIINDEIENKNTIVMTLPKVTRKEYLNIISACDFGIVCTIRDVTVPTFPSKTLDYLLSGIPILASIEESTDYGQFIEQHKIGRTVTAGDIEELTKVAHEMSATLYNKKDASDISARCLREQFSVEKAAAIILKTYQ